MHRFPVILGMDIHVPSAWPLIAHSSSLIEQALIGNDGFPPNLDVLGASHTRHVSLGQQPVEDIVPGTSKMLCFDT
ncbi:hypothetical protein ASE70_16275 [Sphingomonas sp. Leaf22]|nr:hypothetical protein ASE70_16275 [Sphingomonas sp. Leaf22]